MGSSLIWKDPTCHGATKLRQPQLLSLRFRAHALQQEKPLQWEDSAPQLESGPPPRLLQLKKAHMQQWRPSAAKNNLK